MMKRKLFGGLLALLVVPCSVSGSLPIPELTTETIVTIPVFSNEFVTAILQSPDPTDERLFIASKTGRVYTSALEGGSTQVFLNIASITSTSSEQGLLSMEFHPKFSEENWFFFVNHTNLSGQTVVARYEMSEADRSVVDTSTRRVLLTINQDAANHNGGAMKFGADGYLYIAMGDGGGGNDPNCRSQNMASRLGKMLRIDVDQSVDASPYHGIPADNPFVDDPGVPDSIYYSGLRNPWRFSFDRDTGDMWIADVGQVTREEVNHLVYPYDAALNFGWPIREGDVQNPAISTVQTNCNNAGVTLPPLNFDGFTDPQHTYPRGPNDNRSITGGYVYRGSKSPGLFGRYVFGDYISGRVWVLDPVDYAATESFVLGLGLATFGEDREGELYVGWHRQVRRIVTVPPEITDHLAVE